jgi:hypothetical protein
LKICRKEQGNEIDKAKGLIVKQFPKHWTRYTKKGKKVSDEDADFYNSIMVNKRPYFMRWLYSDYSKKYKLFIDNYNKYSHVMLGKGLLDILRNPETNDEIEFVFKYNRFIPLLETGCLMNEICRHMENQIKELKENVDKEYDLNIIKDILQNKQFRGSSVYKEKYKKFMEKIYEEYKINKCRFSDMTDEKGDQKFKTLEQFNKYLRLEAIKEISSDLSELATLAVDASYTMKGDKSFAWNVFGEGIIENVMDNKQDIVSIPFLDKNGEILYLDSKYSLFDIDFSNKELDIDDYL